MEEVHTHTFVGGPKDGQREMIQGADAERGHVTVRTLPREAPMVGDPELQNEAVPMSETTYERTAYQGEKVRFIFWKARGLSIDEAMAKLFAHYINR